MSNPQIDLQFDYSRYLPNWLNENKCNIAISSYNSHFIFTIGLDDKDQPFLYCKSAPRAMGICYKNNELIASSLGNITTYTNRGELKDNVYGIFDKNFVPNTTIHRQDVDIHDICKTDDGEIYYISAMFSCICKPSKDNKTFEVYWKPPWISKLAAEDRCHLNGLCCIDGKPRFVSSICQGDIVKTWQEKSRVKQGIIYDLENEEIYCEGLSHPHSPRWYNNKLWLLNSGTGYFGHVEDKKFVEKVFIPGFIRGLAFHNNFAVVTTSLDRHNKDFEEYELGDNLEKKGTKGKCGIWIINMESFDIIHNFEFKGDVRELYDTVIIPECRRVRVMDVNDPKLVDNFIL